MTKFGSLFLRLSLWLSISLAAGAADFHSVIVHAADGEIVQLNINEISSIRQPPDVQGHFAKGTNCIIVMTNGKFVLTREPCQTVRDSIRGAE
jgi:hypothetical protein